MVVRGIVGGDACSRGVATHLVIGMTSGVGERVIADGRGGGGEIAAAWVAACETEVRQEGMGETEAMAYEQGEVAVGESGRGVEAEGG